MPQPIAGIAPSQVKEVTVMTVWPSLSATAFGRFWGRLYNIDVGIPVFGVPVTVGRLIALASIPFMLALYFLMRLPRFPLVLVGIKNPWCWQYRLTNRRVIVENPFGNEIKSISLDRFDAIDVQQMPGHRWFHAGDLVFRMGKTETFRIWAVPRPESFRHTCIKAQMSFVGVKQAREMHTAV